MAHPRTPDHVLVEMLDCLEQANGSIRHGATVAGIEYGAYKSRIDTARRRGLKPSSGEKVRVCMQGQVGLPKSIPLAERSHTITGEHSVLVMSDIHVPYHDERALEAAIEHGIKRKADIIVLNGDIIDCAALSRHEKSPEQRMGLTGEIERTRELMALLRSTFPDAQIIYNEGNHEQRLPRYISAHAPELWNLAQLDMRSLLHLPQHNIQWLASMQSLLLGELHVIHGHEYRNSGINVARTVYIAAASNVLMGHHHRSQEYTHRTIGNKVMGVWSTGCLCQLSQPWLIHNQWIHGFAHIELSADGTFIVSNRKVIDGRLY
jgi:predicted phosphodiesterase